MIKFGIGLVSLDGCNKTVYYSQKAEKNGFQYVFVSDHLKGRNITVCLTSIANNTKDILIGPGITNPYSTHPVTLAQILSSLNEIAPNRLICGIGAGDSTNLKRLGISQKKPLSAVKEATQIIRDILNNKKVNIKGKIFKINNQYFDFPESKHLPILIGAQGDKMLKLAGQIGDGVIINSANNYECDRAIKIVQNCRQNSINNLRNFEYAAAMPFSVAKKLEDAVKPVLPGVAIIAAGSPDSVLKRHGISLEDRDKIRDALLHNDNETVKKIVTHKMIDSLSITGTPDNCTERIKLLEKTGISLVILSTPLGPVPEKAIEVIAEEIIPQFKE